MSPAPRRPETPEFFREWYGRDRQEAARSVQAAVLGDDVGLNGYTTPDQADVLEGDLRIGAGSLLLDLGAGRGWPGSRIAERTGCRAVLSDIPIEALRDSFAYLRARGVEGSAWPLGAEGAALPFLDRVFDAVAHADVFC